MNETYEKEINLKWLLYRVLRGWKIIIACALIAALGLGLFSFGMTAIKLLDEEHMETARVNFERKHAAWFSMKQNYDINLENLETSKARQEEYNEKSIMMDIDPSHKWIASFQLYVKYDYKIDPNLTVQNENLSDRILKAYHTYMTNGDMYQYIMDNVGYDIEMRYLTEIFGVEVDYNNNFISLSVVHTNNEACQKILSLAKTGIESRTEQIVQDIDVHSLIVSNQSSNEVIDNALRDTQEANIQAVVRIDESINALNQARIKWENEDIELEDGQKMEDIITGVEPVFEYEPIEIAKSVVKKVIIGGLVGFALAVVCLLVAAVLSGKLLNPDDIKSRYGIRVIGVLPKGRAKKSFAGINRKIAKVGGIKIKPEEYDVLAKVIGLGIKSDIAVRDADKSAKTIAFTGTVSAEELDRAVSTMGIEDYNVVCASDVLANIASIDKVSAADYVVLVEKQENTVIADVEKELEVLKTWNKTVIGAVVLNADAIM